MTLDNPVPSGDIAQITYENSAAALNVLALGKTTTSAYVPLQVDSLGKVVTSGGAGGSDTNVQYNSSGALAGDSGFIYSDGNVRIGAGTPRGPFDVNFSASISAPASSSAVIVPNEFANYQALGNSFSYRIYAHKTTNGIKRYSESYSQADVSDDSGEEFYYVYISWSPVVGADGYRVLISNDVLGYNFNYYYDTAGTDMQDGDGSETDFTLGSTVTPNLRISNFYLSDDGLAVATTNSLGVTQTRNSGLLLANNTVALAGAQQISPAIRWLGQGWKTTATAASQNVEFLADVLPVQGTTNPTAKWLLKSAINAGAFSDLLAVTSAGYVGIGTNSPSSFLQVVTNSASVVPIIAKGATSQSANLQNWTDSSDVVKTSVSIGSGGTPATTYGILNLYNGNSANPAKIYVNEDSSNAALEALYITPYANQTRLHFGISGTTFYALNFANVSNFESVPARINMQTATFGSLSASKIDTQANYLILEAPASNSSGYISSQNTAAASRNSLAFIFHALDTNTYKRIAGFIFAGTGTTSTWTSPHTIWTNNTEATTLMTLNNIGTSYLGIGVAPSAVLTLKAGTATASTSPLKFTTGTVNTSAEVGAMEYNNTFHLTNSDATRRHIATAPNTTKVTAGAPYTNDGYVVINIGGTDFKVMTTA